MTPKIFPAQKFIATALGKEVADASPEKPQQVVKKVSDL
jgi:hypothetical protein